MGIVVGDLRYTIALYALQSIKDEYGSPSESYVLTMTLRAAVKDVSGNKEIDLKEKFYTKTLQFITHYRPVTETMQVEYSGKRYRILNIVEIGMKEGLTITAELINT